MVSGLIAAVDDAWGIGKNGTIPWDAPWDRKMFRDITRGCAVIVGRRTWETLPELPHRRVIVLCGRPIAGERHGSLASAIDACIADDIDVWIAGGYRVYAEALRTIRLDRLVITRVQGRHDCDTFFPIIALLHALRCTT